MPSVRYGGRDGQEFTLALSDDYVAIRTQSRAGLARGRLSRRGLEEYDQLEPMWSLPEMGVEVHRVKAPRGRAAARDRARGTLTAEPDVEFAGRVLCDKMGIPVLYTENLFVKLDGERRESDCRKLLEAQGLTVKRVIPYLENGFFVAAPHGCGMAVFDAAERLFAEEMVELCHPELIKERCWRAAFPQQWHLKVATVGGVEIDAHAHVEEAWASSEGEGIVIAVIDDGVDVDHEELRSPGKIKAPRDATNRSDDPRPGSRDDHGTPCAGVACADGLHGASGVAPKASLMPIRLASGLGSQDEADALVWAAENGADVISCSWGPPDGSWQDADDPRHQAVHMLPDSTRTALDWVTDNGRGGKGCVVTWAAGNGNESVDNDGYASYERVIAVAASNDLGVRSAYSDFGDAVWCSFPSDDVIVEVRTRGIWTTDRRGRSGLNHGSSRTGDRAGHYTNGFGGTSSACPGVAGVVALVLARNPDLNWREVKDLLKRSCEQIDLANGQYDAEGKSPFYGYGRVDARRAVEEAAGMAAPAVARALPPPPRRSELVVRVETDAPVFSVSVDDRPMAFTDGVGRMSLEPGPTYVLSWWVSGPSATTYEISLEAGELAVEGSLPIRRSIARDETKSAGTRKFSLYVP